MAVFTRTRMLLGGLSLLAMCVVIGGQVTLAQVRVSPASPERSKSSGKKPLIICAVPNSMPRMGRAGNGSPQGLDVAVVQLVAEKLGRRLEFHWCASASCSWNCVHERRCDVVIGQPHSSGPQEQLAWSIPYAGSRFGLVVHRDSQNIRSQADLLGKRVGVVAGTFSLSSQKIATIRFKTRRSLLNDFVAKKLDAAFVDDDFAAWHLHRHPKLLLRRVAEYVPRQRWNMGFAVRAGEKTLLAKINQTLRQLLNTGQVSQAFSSQGVSYRAPFTDSARRSAGSDTWKRIRAQGEIVVSMDPANLPYSSAKPERPGFDVELAHALAKKLGVKLRMEWIDVHRETAIGELIDRECDLAFGAAVEPAAVDDEQELAGKVIYSRPYYGSGYLLVTRQNGPQPKSLLELKGPKSRRLGTEAGSVADYRLRQRGYLRRLFRTQLSVLKSLHDGGLDYAYLWANVGWTLHASPDFDVQLLPGYVPEDHWNIAIAMRRGDDELKRHVDAAVQQLVQQGTVSRTLARYHVPYFPAFMTLESRKSQGPKSVEARGGRPLTSGLTPTARQAGVIRHRPTARGLEPNMHRRQRSKKSYGGLERIRASGVLIVGLDQNNLPFSTAHPQPAGLDYEIAGLLAEKLGVSLQVYWAYSSHGSYPSKLANKKFCDCMLGVMPDDRFARRVIYSKPYYFATYQHVTLADAAVGPSTQPLAIERGIAVRGIRGRTMHEYPSLQGILDAVAQGKEQVGYVISTRGHWLAEQRWPGKLKFFSGEGADSVDRFPICVAVRKTDGDLKTAIDRALDELAQSGRMAEVFAHWQIVPFTSPQQKADPSK